MTKNTPQKIVNTYNTPLSLYIGSVQAALLKKEITKQEADFLIALYTRNQFNQKIQLKLNQYFSTTSNNLNSFLSYGREPAY